MQTNNVHLKRESNVEIQIKHTKIPQIKTFKYIEFHLDAKQMWKQYITAKIEEIRLKRR